MRGAEARGASRNFRFVRPLTIWGPSDSLDAADLAASRRDHRPNRCRRSLFFTWLRDTAGFRVADVKSQADQQLRSRSANRLGSR